LSRFGALAVSPRTAVVLAAVVVVVALVVVVLGSRSGVGEDGGGTPVSVTGAPSPDGGSADGVSADGASAVPAPGASADAATGATSTAVPLVVHVVGAVERPGVVSLGAGSRVAVAIERAGGATTEADLARLNLARVVVDGERLYVPRVGETDVPAALDEAAGPAAGGAGAGASAGGGTGAGVGDGLVVDLNTADQAALETLPGIGPALAGRILAWRDEHGRFGAVEDLLDVNGIGDARFADLRDRVRV